MADIKKIIIGGTTYPVKDDSKQVKIDSSNKLSADFVDDTSTTKKFVTSSEKNTWNNKSNFSGSYNDLTDKPTIPDAVSGTNDGTNWTSLTIGSTTKAIPAGGSSGDVNVIETVKVNGSALTPDANKAVDVKTHDAVISHGTSDTTFALTPNILHTWGTVTSLTLTLATPSDATVINEYMFEFTSGSTATTLSLPATVVWDEDKGALTVESGYIYQVSILNNIALWARVAL